MRTAAALSAVAMACAAIVTAHARAEWYGDAGAAFAYDSNVSRAQRASDIRSDHAWSANASGGYYFQLSDRSGASLGASVRREEFVRYHGLSHVALGPNVALRSKLGVGADAPWLRLAASALRLEYDNDVRSGWLLGASAAAGARVHERVDLRAEVRLERRRADHDEALVSGISGAAFDLDSASLALGADYTLGADTLISLGYTYRKGDVVSSTRRNRAIFAVSEAIARDPVFGPDVVAYRLDAHSHVFELGVSRALGARASINLGVARSLTYPTGGNNYYGSSVSASLLYAF